MKARKFQSAKNSQQPDSAISLDGAEAALRRAAQSAYRRAAFYGSKVAIVENGKLVHKTPVPVDPASSKPPADQDYKLV